MSDGTMILTLFAGLVDLFLALTLERPEENQCFRLPILKNLRKINVFALPRASGDPGGTIATMPNRLHFWNKFYNHFCINGPLVSDLEAIIGVFCMSWRCASLFFSTSKNSFSQMAAFGACLEAPDCDLVWRLQTETLSGGSRLRACLEAPE